MSQTSWRIFPKLARNPQYAASILLLILCLIGIGIILFATRWGAGVDNDTTHYIPAARNLASGNGLTELQGDGELHPMVHYPPGLSILLAVPQIIGLDAYIAARYVNALAFGASIFLVGVIARKITRSWGFALLAAGLILVSDVLIETHSWAMTEALYIFLALLGIYWLALYLDNQKQRWLVLSALVTGFAILTRYIGVSLLMVAGVGLFFISQQSWKRRISDALTFTIISLAPIIWWTFSTYLVFQRLSDRAFGDYLMSFKQLTKVINTILRWFLPGRVVNGREFLILLVLFIGSAIILLGVRRYLKNKEIRDLSCTQTSLCKLLALQIVFHLLTLFVSKSFFDPTTPMNSRILSPILPAIIILVNAILADIWRAEIPLLRVLVAGFSLILVVFPLYKAVPFVRDMHTVGIGFAQRRWHTSETVAAVNQLDQVVLFTNGPGALHWWTGRPVYSLANLPGMRQSLEGEPAVLVVLKKIPKVVGGVSVNEITKDWTPLQTLSDGKIYQIPTTD